MIIEERKKERKKERMRMKLLVLLILAIVTLFGAVDINNASAKELSSLKGIGIKKAEAILTYRKTHCFKSIDEFVKVNGIGSKTLEKNRKNLKIGSCK